jgi:hypothetical protein
MVERIRIAEPEEQLGPRGESCKLCRFFERVPGQGEECRQDSPLGVLASGPGGNPVAIGFWPSTRAHQWCGKFEPR